MRKDKYTIGVDLGGTKILSAILTNTGKIIAKVQVPTEADKGKAHVTRTIKDSIRSLLKTSNISLSQISCIGIGAPGPVLTKKGIIFDPPNLPGWKRVPLKRIMEKEFKKPVVLGNDADAAALGEAIFGAGKGLRNFVYITVSTGIGGGIVIDGELYTGAVGGAGEIGHMKITDDGPRCGCGRIGCLEALASGKAMARRAKEEIAKGCRSLMIKLVDGRIENLSAFTVETAARLGDKLAKDIINEASRYLGIGLSNIINILAPDMIAIGGGVSNMGDIFLKPAIRIARESSLSPAGSHVKIIRAKLRRDVGVLGAAALCIGGPG
jgi:glucokinase